MTDTLYERIPGGTIEAMQLTETNRGTLFDWTEGAFQPTNGIFEDTLWVEANKIRIPLEVGEWVAKDALGFYPIKDEQFRKSWRKAEPQEDDPRSNGELLDDMGTDALNWAEEFEKRFVVWHRFGHEGEDYPDNFTSSLLLGWFASALAVGFEQGRQYALDPKNKEVELDSYTNYSYRGDKETVRVGDKVAINFGYFTDEVYTVKRIFKPTPKSRVQYELIGGTTRRWNPVHAHNYRKVTS